MVEDAVRVYARLRPVRPGCEPASITVASRVNEVGEPTGVPSQVLFDGLDASRRGRDGGTKAGKVAFGFTEVFDGDASQESVFEVAAHGVVTSALEGYNGTLFAYGQTGSGKTFTMAGGERPNERGIIPRTIESLFQKFGEREDTKWTWYMGVRWGCECKHLTVFSRSFVSYMEVYNEVIYDLLDDTNRGKPIEEWNKIEGRFDGGELHLGGLLVHQAATVADALDLFKFGRLSRTTGATRMNQASSRSHSIFRVTIEARPVDSETVRTSKLNLVDLAGSERVDNAPLAGPTRREGRCINLSLLYLKQVIMALNDRSRGHVPYRNSTMTSVLRDSLGGNCRTVFVVTLNAEAEFVDESFSTCRFSQECSTLSNTVNVNETVDPVAQIQLLKLEVARLRDKAASDGAPRAAAGGAPATEADDKEQELERLKHIIDALTADRDKWKHKAAFAEDRDHWKRRAEDLEAQYKARFRQTKRSTVVPARPKREEAKQLLAVGPSRVTFSCRPSPHSPPPSSEADERFMSLLHGGAVFVKHGRRGKPHKRLVWVSADDSYVAWCDPSKKAASGFIPVRNLTRVVPGANMSVFSRAKLDPDRHNACFSIVAKDRTLDLEVKKLEASPEADKSEVQEQERAARNKWVAAFDSLIVSQSPVGAASGFGAVGDAEGWPVSMPVSNATPVLPEVNPMRTKAELPPAACVADRW